MAVHTPILYSLQINERSKNEQNLQLEIICHLEGVIDQHHLSVAYMISIKNYLIFILSKYLQKDLSAPIHVHTL